MGYWAGFLDPSIFTSLAKHGTIRAPKPYKELGINLEELLLATNRSLLQKQRTCYWVLSTEY